MEKIEKAGVKFSENIDIRVLNKRHEWVSRGGVKLSDAIKKFDVEINEKSVLMLERLQEVLPRYY